jgi:hypothetical protein
MWLARQSPSQRQVVEQEVEVEEEVGVKVALNLNQVHSYLSHDLTASAVFPFLVHLALLEDSLLAVQQPLLVLLKN